MSTNIAMAYFLLGLTAAESVLYVDVIHDRDGDPFNKDSAYPRGTLCFDERGVGPVIVHRSTLFALSRSYLPLERITYPEVPRL